MGWMSNKKQYCTLLAPSGGMSGDRERGPVEEIRRRVYKRQDSTVRVWVLAKESAHTYMDMVTSLWFICTLGLPPGLDRDGQLFKKPFPPRAAQETSGRSEQSASSFIKHLQERSWLDTRTTFEIPPVTSQTPKHGSWSFKYLHVRRWDFYLREQFRRGKKGNIACLQRFATRLKTRIK